MAKKTKQCNKCGKRKSFSEFYKHPTTKDGLRSFCKKCISNYGQKYRQSTKGKEYQEQYRRTHKIERAKYGRKYGKKYRKTLIGYLRYRFREMKRRCNSPKAINYKYYGGRGIKCLFKSSQEFVDYVINKLQINPHGLDIDRIDNDGHYEPGNIRFITHAENNRNKQRK